MVACEYCDDDDGGPTFVYQDEAGSRMRMHAECFQELSEESGCNDDDEPLHVFLVNEVSQ